MKNTTILVFFIGLLGISRAQNVPISGGNNFSAVVSESQKIYVWGANTEGQLGVDANGNAITDQYKNMPFEVVYGNNSATTTATIGLMPMIKKVDAGAGSQLLALSCDHQLWSWGANQHGQLGRTNTPSNAFPSRVMVGSQDVARNNNLLDPNNIYLDGISAFSGGSYSSFAVEDATGCVLAWGDNAYGQLGNGTTIDQPYPVYVLKEDGTRLTNIISVKAGESTTYALDANGNVWSWGHVSESGGQTFTLGRTTNLLLPTATGGTCAPRAARVTISTNLLNPGFTNCSLNFLSNIVEISAGYSHCLALDGNGNVWSFGADWGNGQLGRGNQAVYQSCASRVVAPGVVKTADWVESDFLGNGIDGKAISVSAGQASSAVLLSNGKVVTFGARGIFSTTPLVTATGSTISCITAFNSMLTAGVLGDGDAACNKTTCELTGVATNHSKTPVYVKGIPVEEKIVQISKGDAWYFAITNTRKIYTWGWNRRGELGVGDYSDKCQATLLTLPTGVAVSLPCHSKPNLGPDLQVCPVGIYQVLSSGITSPTSAFKWYFTADLKSQKMLISSANTSNYTATKYGYYIVEVSDTRLSVSSECGPCKTLSDTVYISDFPNAYTTNACYDQVAQKGIFTINTPTPSKIKWYATATSTTALNGLDSLATIVSSTTQQSNCNGMYGLFAEDVSRKSGTVINTGAALPTLSQIATAIGCVQNSWNNNEGSATQIMIEVSRPIKLKSVSLLMNGPVPVTTPYNLSIYANNPIGNMCINNCMPPRYTDGKSISEVAKVAFNPNYTTTNAYKVVVVNLDVTLPAGKYWIGSDAQWQVSFNCNPTLQTNSHLWQVPYTDTDGVLKVTTAYKNSSYMSKGAYFDLQYETGTSYPCNRIPVCATSVCVITETSDTQFDESITLNPNPNNGSFTLNTPSVFAQAAVSITDAMGHTVYNGYMDQAKTEFSLSHLPSGVYIIRLQTSQRTAVNRLVIE